MLQKDVALCKLITCDDFEIDVLGYLNTLYQSKQLNYIQSGGKQLPMFGPLQTLATKLVEGVSKELGWIFKR